MDASGGVPARVPDPGPPEVVPKWKAAWRWWLGKSAIIVRKQNRVIAWLAYWIGVGPVAWVMRLRGEDRLDRKTRPVGATGWHKRDEPIPIDPQRIRRPF